MNFTKDQKQELQQQGTQWAPVYQPDTKVKPIKIEDFTPVVTPSKFGDWNRASFTLEGIGELTIGSKSNREIDEDGELFLRRYVAKIDAPFTTTSGSVIQPGQAKWYVTQG